MTGAAPVRQPLRAGQRSHRTLDQSLAVRFPALGAAFARLLTRLAPDARLRRAFVLRSARLAVEAYNRRDLDSVVIGCAPDFEWVPDRNWIEAGLMDPSYRGIEGYRRYVAGTAEVFGGDVLLEPREIVDTGDHLLLLADVPMRAQASGVPLTESWALVSTLQDGRIVRMQEFYDDEEAFRAAGARE